jgi:multidrug efflux pump subunit AcrA (membrane-fusion protein)
MRLKSGKRTLIAALALVVVGVGAVGYAVVGPGLSKSSAPQYLTATVSRGTVAVQAVATGTVESVGTYGLSFGADPELATSTAASTATAASTSAAAGAVTWVVQKVDVQVGQAVTRGQVLASADPTDAKAELAVAQANLAAAEARLSVDEGHPSASIIATAQDAVNGAGVAVSTASHTRDSTLQQNALAVTTAEHELADAQANLATAQAGPTADQVAVAQGSVNQAQLTLQAAQQSLTDLQAKDALSIAAAQQAVTNAQTNLTAAQAQYASAAAKLTQDSQPVPVPSGAPLPPDPATLAADQAALASASAAATKAQQDLDTAETGLSSAQANATAAENGATAQVASAQNALTTAEDTYAVNTTPSATAITQAQQAVQSAQDNLASAKEKSTASATQLNDSLAQAQQSLQSARDSYTKTTGPAEADVTAADKAAIASAQVNVTTATDTLNYATLASPADGVIVAVNVQPGIVAPSGYALVVQAATLEATAAFAETSVASLKLGQPAAVSVTGPNVTVNGTVSEIVPTGSVSGTNSVVTFNVTVTLEDPPASVLAGMSTSVAITTAQAQNVLRVPAIAVGGSSGSYSVQVVGTDGQAQAVPVQVGLMSSSLAEIKGGLNEGQTVVIGTLSARTATTTTGGSVGIPGVGIPGVGPIGGGRGLDEGGTSGAGTSGGGAAQP